MLRAQTLVTLKEYNSAMFDVNRLIELNPSSEVYHNLQARLKTQVALAPIPEAEAELEEDEEEGEEYGRSCTVEKEEEDDEIMEAVEKEEEQDEIMETVEKEEEQDEIMEDIVVPAVRKYLSVAELNEDLVKAEMITPEKPDQVTECKNMPERNSGVAASREPDDKDSKGYQAIHKQKGQLGQKNVPQRIGVDAPREQSIKDSNGWQAIPKPKGHSALDYARWDRVEDDSSEDDDDSDEEESQPQYRFRVRTVGMRPVK
ncbi:hypothetical protein PTKIN_Ptkin14bG0228500 [Pterospermum kingtungense]